MRGVTYREKVLLLGLAFRDGPGGAYPSYEELADLTGIPRARVADTIKALECKGALARTRRQRSNLYAVDYAHRPDEAATRS